VMCGGFVGLAATRTVASGVAAGTASTCESARSALKIAIAIVRFFSIRKSPIRQPDYRMVKPSARGSGAAIAKWTPPFALGKRAAFSRGFGCEVNPHSGAQHDRGLDESKFSFPYTPLSIS
jgi:hypothetical protein